jgi:cobalamin biosynthesis protein CobC
VGFVCAHSSLLDPLQNLLGPWCINAAARWVATTALNDQHWQIAARQQLMIEGERLYSLLSQHGLTPGGGSALFQWVCTHSASDLHQALAQRGILTRLFNQPDSLRFGLPATDQEWMRLDAALYELTSHK